jgi:hypothetical protein
MTTCPHCGHTIASNQLLCSHCGRPQLLANHQTVLLALPPIGLAICVTLVYWIVGQLVWLPFTQPIFYQVADGFGLAYLTSNLEGHSFFNGAWLVGGALLYIPLITYGGLRFGLKNIIVAALFGSMPFAFLDNWAWSARPAPGIVQFLIVFVITAILIAVLHFLFIYLSDRWPARFAVIRAQTIKSSNFIGRAPLVRTQPEPAAPPSTASPMAATRTPDPEPVANRKLESPVPQPESIAPPDSNPEPQPLVETPEPIPSAEPRPESPPAPEMVVPTPAPTSTVSETKTVFQSEVQSEPKIVPPPAPPAPLSASSAPPAPPPSPTPKPVPLSSVNESAPPAFKVEDEDSSPDRQGGIPAWIIVVGLGVLIVIGIVLIVFALQS